MLIPVKDISISFRYKGINLYNNKKNNTMMTWEQVPLKEQHQLRVAFCNDPSIKKLDQLATQLQNKMDFIGALNIKKEIEAQWEYVKQTHLKSYDKTVQETVKLSELGFYLKINYNL